MRKPIPNIIFKIRYNSIKIGYNKSSESSQKTIFFSDNTNYKKIHVLEQEI